MAGIAHKFINVQSPKILIKFTAVMLFSLVCTSLLEPKWTQSYAIIHTFLETFCIVIALFSFFVIWFVNNFRQTNIILALGFLTVAIFDFFHTFYWQGLDLFPMAYYDLSARYWIIGRLIEALFLFLSTTAINRMPIPRLLGLVCSVLFSLTVGFLFYTNPGIFPILLTPEGVTPIKIVLEYMIISIFILFLVRVYKGYFQEDIVTKEYLILASLIAIPAELCFTLFTTITNYYNVLGHVLKVIYYYFFLRAIIAGFVVYPYRMLQLSEKNLAKTNTELNISQQKMVNLVECIKAGFYILDRDWRFTYVNEEITKLFAKKKEELIGKKIWTCLPGLAETTMHKNFKKVMDERTPISFKMPAIYSKKFFEIKINPIEEGICILLYDITEHKELENELRESRDRYHSLFVNSMDGILITQYNGDIVSANPAFCQIVGRTEEEICRLNRNQVVDASDTRLHKLLTERGKLGYCKGEFNLVHKNGLKIPVEGTSQVYSSSKGETFTSMILRDLTEKMKNQQEIARLDRLHQIGEVSASIAHEVRNPLTTIRGFLQLLALKGHLKKENIILMLEEIDRANGIITEFLSLAQNKPIRLKRSNLNTVVKNFLPVLQAEGTSREKTIITDFHQLPDMELDENEIRQLTLNLVKNGFEAMENGNKLTIQTFCDNEQITLAVQDEGSGIPHNIIDKIKEPFFTTKETGTGLGLKVCYSIAARHNAAIDFITSPNGTTFFVRFNILSKNEMDKNKLGGTA